MAKLEQGVFGGFIGRIGSVIGYRRGERWCMRSMPAHVRNPRTEAQQRHRSLFREEVQLAARMRRPATMCLTQLARERHMTAQNLFVRLNHGCFDSVDFTVDYGRLRLSLGPVAPVAVTGVSVEPLGAAHSVGSGYLSGSVVRGLAPTATDGIAHSVGLPANTSIAVGASPRTLADTSLSGARGAGDTSIAVGASPRTPADTSLSRARGAGDTSIAVGASPRTLADSSLSGARGAGDTFLLTVRFDTGRPCRLAGRYDEVYLYAYSPSAGKGYLFNSVYRYTRRVSVLLPDWLQTDDLQLYLMVGNSRGDWSPTVHATVYENYFVSLQHEKDDCFHVVAGAERVVHGAGGYGLGVGAGSEDRGALPRGEPAGSAGADAGTGP